MNTNKQLIKYKSNSIKQWFSNLFNSKNWFIGILNTAKNKLGFKKSLLNKDVLNKINSEFPDEDKQKEVKELLEELLSRNNDLLETLDVRILDKQYVDLFGKPKLERIINDNSLQKQILDLSNTDLQIYSYILNYNLVNFNERISNLNVDSLQYIDLNSLQNLDEKDKIKAISTISSSVFRLTNLDELDNYYEERKSICKQVIDNPQIVDIEKNEYEKYLNIDSSDDIENSEYNFKDTILPFEFLDELSELSNIDRIKCAIIEAKYGMKLEKAKILCSAFGDDIENVNQSESTRIVKELKSILTNDDIDSLKQINLDENYANYEGSLDIVSNLKNAYLEKYQETLYQINPNDYIGTQSIKINGKKSDVEIYNVLGKNNDNANFNMILTSVGGIYPYGHNYNNLKADWYRATKNHTISCSYIGNDFLSVVNSDYLLAFSDIQKNELLRASNSDAGTVDFTTDLYEELQNNTFLTPENEINLSKNYNELLVERKIESDGKLINRTPTFAVFMAESIDDINDDKNERWLDAKKHAAALNIPIAVIDVSQCMNLEFQKTQEMVERVKKEKRMDLIPDIIQKIENNYASQTKDIVNTKNKVFSKENINNFLEEIMKTIITSDISTFNQGIEEFAKITKKIKNNYNEFQDPNLNIYQSYDYDAYLDRLKILFSSRNGLNSNSIQKEYLSPPVSQLDNTGQDLNQ
jgi:hypothetical protein